MKYCSINQFENFEFHDAITNFISYEDSNMVIGVECLNIHKNVELNPYDFDMEIEYAEITFDKITVHSFSDADSIQYEGEDAIKKFYEQITNSITILSFGLEKDNIYYLEGIGGEPFFTMCISFENICVEWENYKKKAWYELIHHYEKEICLDTKTGEKFVSLSIIFNEEVEGDEIVSLRLNYNGKDYFEYGNDYFWINSFAKLQNKLPEDVQIKCCLTCRYGNMCPAGNRPGEVFCTSDIKVSQKSDLYFYTEDENERVKRLRFYTDVCDDYQMQNEEYFTYNDYLYSLNNKE